MVITQEELNIPNLIELYLEKANTSISKSQLFQNILTDKRLVVKFSQNRVFLQETDQKQIELEYKNVLYLNNSITNENFFCLAYGMPPEEKSRSLTNQVNALILYSNDVEIIDDVIRDYAFYISSELNKKDSKTRYTNGMDDEIIKVEQHTCYLCPMQQFIELCEYLNTYSNQQEINDILVEKLNQNLNEDDQSYLFDCLNYHSLTMETYSNLRDKNQLIVALIHKICKKKQIQHLIESLKRKNEESLIKRNGEFFLMKNSRFSGCWAHSKSSHSNLDCLETNLKKKTYGTKRSKSVDLNPIFTNRSSFKAKQNDNRNLKNKATSQNSPQNKLVFEKFFEKISTDTNLDSNGIFLSNKDCAKRFIFNKIVGFPTSVCIVSTSMPLANVNIASKPTIEQVEDLMADKETAKPAFVFKRFGNRGDIIKFWKKVISEQIILNKMEKENRKLSIRASCAAQKETKHLTENNFKYVEITPCLKDAITIWKALLNNQYLSLAVLTLNDLDSPTNSEQDEKVLELEKIRKIVFKGKFLN